MARYPHRNDSNDWPSPNGLTFVDFLAWLQFVWAVAS